jgi:ParB-like chromosome segregation protein Spo0J
MSKIFPVQSSSRLAVTYRAVSDLVPDPRNARTHPKRQIDQIKASIEAFGFTNPILVDPDGHIIAGHGRLQAARAIGLTEVPTIILPGLSETQKRALRIADNKIALNAGWDLEILQLELGELASIDILRSRHNSKILGVDDAEIVGDRITEVRPIPRNFFTEEIERCIGELGVSRVGFIVRDMLVHHAP